MELNVLREIALDEHDTRPLLIWVHPGDACESDFPDADIREASFRLQEEMGQEILERLETHRIVVIQRQSTAFAFEPEEWRMADPYLDAMGRILDREDTTWLWGDDLEKASSWILERRAQAPEAFLTGAWSHPEWGCVTAVGEGLLEANLPVKISPFSPSEPGTTLGAWRPSHSENADFVETKKPSKTLKP